MDVLVALVILHIVPVILAIWGAFRRSPWIHVPAILVLMSDLLGYMMVQSISWDRFPPGLAWIAAGPLFAPVELGQAVVAAPLWAGPILLCGVVTGVLIWRWLWRRAKWRAWTFAGVLGGVIAMVLLAETGMEAAMRIRAAQQMPGYCSMYRGATPTMIGVGLSARGTGRTSHGWITDGRTIRYWSIRETGFGQPFACERDAWVCRC